MDAFASFRLTKSSGIAGSLISLAVMLGGSSSFADGLTGFGAGSLEQADFLAYSHTDLEQLDHATVAGATAARLAAMDQAMPRVSQSRSRPGPATAFEQEAPVDVFAHSGRILPLLVTRPDADLAGIQSVASTVRPRVAAPVGVSRSSLRNVR